MTTSRIIPKIWVSAFLIVACAAAGFLTYKIHDKYSQSNIQAQILKNQNNEYSAGVSTTDNFLSNYLKRQADAKTLGLSLPAHNSDMSNFISNLGEIAQQSGVKLSGFQAQEVAANKPVEYSIQVLSVTLAASGTYASLRDFVLRLENNLRLIDVTHIGLSTGSDGNLEYQMAFRIYYQK